MSLTVRQFLDLGGEFVAEDIIREAGDISTYTVTENFNLNVRLKSQTSSLLDYEIVSFKDRVNHSFMRAHWDLDNEYSFGLKPSLEQEASLLDLYNYILEKAPKGSRYYTHPSDNLQEAYFSEDKKQIFVDDHWQPTKPKDIDGFWLVDLKLAKEYISNNKEKLKKGYLAKDYKVTWNGMEIPSFSELPEAMICNSDSIVNHIHSVTTTDKPTNPVEVGLEVGTLEHSYEALEGDLLNLVNAGDNLGGGITYCNGCCEDNKKEGYYQTEDEFGEMSYIEGCNYVCSFDDFYAYKELVERQSKGSLIWTQEAADQGIELQEGMQCKIQGVEVIVDYLGVWIAVVTSVDGSYKETPVDKQYLLPISSKTPLEIQRDEVLEFMDNNCHMNQVELVLAMQQEGFFKDV